MLKHIRHFSFVSNKSAASKKSMYCCLRRRTFKKRDKLGGGVKKCKCVEVSEMLAQHPGESFATKVNISITRGLKRGGFHLRNHS